MNHFYGVHAQGHPSDNYIRLSNEMVNTVARAAAARCSGKWLLTAA